MKVSDEEVGKYMYQSALNYFKLAAMRMMQDVVEHFDMPESEKPRMALASCARLLNEAVYTIGMQIHSGKALQEILSKDQLMNLFIVLNGQPLNQFDRTDIDMSLEKQKNEFKKFIEEKGQEFHLSQMREEEKGFLVVTVPSPK